MDGNLSDRKASLETDMGNTPSESSSSSRNVTTDSSERSCVRSCGYNDIRLNHGKSLEHATSSIETAQSSGANLRFQPCPYQDYRYRDGSAAKNPSFDGSDDSNWIRRETSSQVKINFFKITLFNDFLVFTSFLHFYFICTCTLLHG